jgi:LCP family protein required for cell wall assembly
MNVTKVGKVELDETEIQESISETVQSNESMKGYTNIALFGVDSREGQLNKNTRSDTIIIASINNETHDIKLVSVYRDTYLNLSNDTYSKANAAYAAGGPQQAISMLNMNLDMDIEDFVTIGFDGLIDVIDDLGGVEINVQENEISHLNNYQISMVGTKSGTNAAGEDNFVATEGVDYTPVTSSGLQTLNGLQATAYCRIRYVGNDFQRAQRQRDVLMAVLEKAKTKPSKLADIAADVFDETYTSLDLSEITELLSDIASYNVTGNDGFPYADYRKTGTLGKAGSCVVACDLTDNVQWLHEFLFDETDYECSSDVQTISDHIKSVASQYTLN